MGDTQTTKAAETARVKQKTEDRPPHEHEYAPSAFAEATLFRAAASDDPTIPPQHMARVLRRLTTPHQKTGFLRQCQRHYGNAYVQRMVSSRDNGHSSPLKQEAYTQEEPIAPQVTTLESGMAPDGVAAAHAEQAASLGGPENIAVQTKPLAVLITPNVQRQKGKDDEEDTPILTKSAGSMADTFEPGADVETQISQSKGRGSPLPEPVRAYMEPRFGVDFNQVRVHTGSNAIHMNQAVGAQAFTVGRDIYYGAGKEPTDLSLTAHELTHVVQQNGDQLQRARTQAKKKADAGGAPSEQGKGPVNFLSTTLQKTSEASSPSRTPTPSVIQRANHEEGSENAPVRSESALNFLSVEGGQDIEAQIQSTRGGGQSLSASDRGLFESSFNHDFSQISLHTDAAADSLNRSLNAKAFTTGHDIYFSQGAYQPGSSTGQELLAHELTHVVQQESGPVSGTAVGGGLSVSDPSDRHEQAAEQNAKTVMRDIQNQPASPAPSSPPSSPQSAISRATIQRDDAPAASMTAEELIDKHTSWGNLDEEELGQELAGMLPAQTNLTHQVLDELGNRNRDDVSYEIVIAPGLDLKALNMGLRMRFVRELTGGVVTDDEEGAIATIWISFESTPGEVEPGLREAAEGNRDLWKKSLWESDQLVEHIKPIYEAFGVDVRGLALEYLKENKQSLMDEANRYGIDLEGEQGTAPAQTDYLQSVRAMVPGVLKLQQYQEELKKIRVGYYQMSDCLIGECLHDSYFNPDYEPQKPPTGEESPPWPTWQEVKTQYDRASALIASFANIYPTIYILMQQGNLEDLSKADDAAKAQEVIRTALRTSDEKIKESAEKIGTGDITYYDLKMIQSQLLNGPAQVPYEARYHWETPFYQDIANDDIKGHEARQFWVDLGLSLVAAAALIAAPFTGGATAAFLVGFGLGIGAAQAGMSWEKYLDMSTIADAEVKKELMLISEGEVRAQLIDAIVQTIAVFLDAYGAGASATAQQSIQALKLAEKGVKEGLEAAAKKKALREAGKEAALVLGGTGVAVGLHEMADDEPVPTFEGQATQYRVDLGPDPTPPTSSVPADRQVIQRNGGGKVPPIPSVSATPKQPIILTGDEFEGFIEKALLKGPLDEIPKMSFVLPLQYRGGSNWGIDRFGVIFDEATGALDVYHLEMKWVSPGSDFVPELGKRASGTQTGAGWTKNAIEGFLTSPHDNARAAKERLRRMLKKMHPGETIDIARMRSFLEATLPNSKVRIIVPNWADFSKLYKQVAALIRHGREISIVKVFK